jgi:hypothetical protein
MSRDITRRPQRGSMQTIPPPGGVNVLVSL